MTSTVTFLFRRRLVLIAAALALALSGCGGDSGQSTSSASATAAATITTSASPPSNAVAILTTSTLAFSAANYAVAQNAGAITVTVNRTGTATQAVTVQYATSDGTATSGAVYTATHGALIWAANDATSRSFSIVVTNAMPFTGTKAFTVALSKPSGTAALGTLSAATIAVAGDLKTGSLQLSAVAYSVAANSGSLTVTVNRSGDTSAAASVAYGTADGTAKAGTNYTAAQGTLNWAANDAASKTFAVQISNTLMTGSAAFNIGLSAASGAQLGAGSTATVTITPVAATGTAIRVSGNHLVDANGKTVQLRGVNVSGLESVAIQGWDPSNPWGAQTGDPTPNWSSMQRWGANAVRLPLNEASWLGLSCTDIGGTAGKAGAIIKADPGGNYQATVEQSVADATAAGLYVILDLHWAAPNDGGTPACPTTQNAMADADHSIAFWTSIADRFKTNPAVILELFNEPFLDSAGLVGNAPWPDLLNGGVVTKLRYNGGAGSKKLNWATAGMQQMLDAVRATGATNVVLTSTLAYSSQMDGWLKYKPTDPAGQLGAVWHAYPAAQYPTQVTCVSDNIINVWLPQCSALEMAAVQAIVAAGFPVVTTEFGDAIGGKTAPWASILLPFADANGVSYMGWTWDTWTGQNANVLITDAEGDPSQGFGTYVKQHYLCRAAGTDDCN